MPADGAIGVNGTLPVEVRFSEPMNASSLLYAITPSVPSSSSWPAADTLQIAPDPPGFPDCTIVRVEVRVNDSDEGLPLTQGATPNPWSFMTSCDRPYIVATLPADGDGNVREDGDLVITFSEPMDCLTIQVLFSPVLPPPGTILTSCDVSRAVITVQLTGGTRLRAGTTYTATASGQDDDGNPLVTSSVPNPWSFTVNEPPVVSTPLLSASGCLGGGTEVVVTWGMSDDTEVAANLTVRLLFLNGSLWEAFTGPAAGFSSPASYRWTLPVLNVDTRVRAEARDSAGALGWNESGSFRIDTGPPRVLGTDPLDGARDVPIQSNLTIFFSEPMNRASVETAISSVPALGGAQFAWSSGDRVLAIRPGGLPDRTFFRITVAATARDTCGAGWTLGSDVVFTFTTGRAPARPPARVWIVAFDESSITLQWDRVTTFVTGSPIPPASVITYRVYRGNGTDIGTAVAETGGTQVSDRNLQPLTNYTYRIVAVVDGVPSAPTAPLTQPTRPPFLLTPEGQISVAVSFAAVAVATAAGAAVRRRRKSREAEVQLSREIQDVLAKVRKVRTEANPEIRRREEEALQQHFRALVVGEEDAPIHPRLEGLYRALAAAIVHSPEVDVSRGRKLVDAELGPLAPNLRQHGAAYRLLSEAEASVQSELFPSLPGSARKALLLVYFYALEEYLGHRLRGLVPIGATVLLGDRGHINVRRRGWEQQWASLTLGNLLYLMDHNRHFFIADEERWEQDVEPVLREAVGARNRTAHPSREGPPVEKVRDLVYRTMPAIESVLKWPTGPVAS